MTLGTEGVQVDAGLVAFGSAVVTFIAWLSRLESKGASNTKEIDRLQQRQDSHENRMSELDLRLMEKLSKIENIVAKIEGSLDRDRP